MNHQSAIDPMQQDVGTGDASQNAADWQPREERQKATLMVGRLIRRSTDHLCRVRNISSSGMLIECEARLLVHESVQVELRNLNVVSGTVRWIKAGQAGLQFDTPIIVANFLNQSPDAQFKPRAPRLGASAKIVLWHAGHNRSATLIDVSQTGCRLELSERLPADANVRISIPGLPARHATMRWSKMGVGGFAFLEPLAFADLMGWDDTRLGL